MKRTTGWHIELHVFAAPDTGSIYLPPDKQREVCEGLLKLVSESIHSGEGFIVDAHIVEETTGALEVAKNIPCTYDKNPNCKCSLCQRENERIEAEEAKHGTYEQQIRQYYKSTRL